jgi:hypothetical protein
VRKDCTKASTHNDFKKAQDTCRDLERECGLRQFSSREHGLGERGIKPAEQERAGRAAAVEVDARRLERKCAMAMAAKTTPGINHQMLVPTVARIRGHLGLCNRKGLMAETSRHVAPEEAGQVWVLKNSRSDQVSP